MVAHRADAVPDRELCRRAHEPTHVKRCCSSCDMWFRQCLRCRSVQGMVSMAVSLVPPFFFLAGFVKRVLCVCGLCPQERVWKRRLLLATSGICLCLSGYWIREGCIKRGWCSPLWPQVKHLLARLGQSAVRPFRMSARQLRSSMVSSAKLRWSIFARRSIHSLRIMTWGFSTLFIPFALHEVGVGCVERVRPCPHSSLPSPTRGSVLFAPPVSIQPVGMPGRQADCRGLCNRVQHRSNVC